MKLPWRKRPVRLHTQLAIDEVSTRLSQRILPHRYLINIDLRDCDFVGKHRDGTFDIRRHNLLGGPSAVRFHGFYLQTTRGTRFDFQMSVPTAEVIFRFALLALAIALALALAITNRGFERPDAIVVVLLLLVAVTGSFVGDVFDRREGIKTLSHLLDATLVEVQQDAKGQLTQCEPRQSS